MYLSVHSSSVCFGAVNLGDDADTVGAIYGQLAGAYYGMSAIPNDWLAKCALKPLIELFAIELFTLGGGTTPIPQTPLPSPIEWGKLYPVLERDECKCDYTL